MSLVLRVSGRIAVFPLSDESDYWKLCWEIKEDQHKFRIICTFELYVYVYKYVCMYVCMHVYM